MKLATRESRCRKEISKVVVGNVGDSEILLGSRTSGGATLYEALTKVHHLKRSVIIVLLLLLLFY